MLGKASEIKTILVESYCDHIDGVNKCFGVDVVINRALQQIATINASVVSIQYQMSQNVDLADSALIIYKEATA